MEIKELFGKTITKAYAVFGMEQGWLDTADCFIELDNSVLIGLPFFYDNEVWVRKLPENAEQLFKEKDQSIVINRKITDFVWYENDDHGGYFLLDDGTLITETRMSPSGTGQAGLNFYSSLQELTSDKGADIKKLSELQHDV